MSIGQILNEGVSQFKLIVSDGEALGNFSRLTAAGFSLYDKSRFKTAIAHMNNFSVIAGCFPLSETIKYYAVKCYNLEKPVLNLKEIQMGAFGVASFCDCAAFFKDKNVTELYGQGTKFGHAGAFGATVGFIAKIWENVNEQIDNQFAAFHLDDPASKFKAAKSVLSGISDLLNITLIVVPYFTEISKKYCLAITVVAKTAALGEFLIQKQLEIKL